MPPILQTPGTIRPRQLGPMIRAPSHVRQLDHLGDVAARDALGDDHDQLDPVEDRLEDGVLGEGGGDGDDRAVDRAAVVLDRLGDGVEDRHAVHLAALAAGGDAADHLGAVVEALAGQVDRLAAGDPLDDEGRLLAISRMLIDPALAVRNGLMLPPGSWRRRGRPPPTSRPSGRSTRPRSGRGS